MKLKLTLVEFIQAAVEGLKAEYNVSDNPKVEFIKHYPTEGEGKMYDLPDYVYIEAVNKLTAGKSAYVDNSGGKDAN